MKQLKLISKIRISDFNYTLPIEKIAYFPKENRDESKLLVYQNNTISDAFFYDIASYLSESDILIFNNSKVIHARLMVCNLSGAKIEIFCLEPLLPTTIISQAFEQTKRVTWKCFVGNARKWKSPIFFNVNFGGVEIQIKATKSESDAGSFEVTFEWDNDKVSFAEWIDAFGKMPLPPYIKREVEESDELRYQTIFAKYDGSVAAPTAGLHFTEKIFEQIQNKKIDIQWLTLHVGAGTFKPVVSEYIEDHFMHQEQIIVTKDLIQFLIGCNNKRIIAVGTTVTRSLESIFIIGAKLKLEMDNPMHVSQWEVYDNSKETAIHDISKIDSLEAILDYLNRTGTDSLVGYTSLMIIPGYQHKIAKGILTNFHQPQSTLLLLISSYLGDEWRKVYQHALDQNYRFLSYGDANLYLV